MVNHGERGQPPVPGYEDERDDHGDDLPCEGRAGVTKGALRGDERRQAQGEDVPGVAGPWSAEPSGDHLSLTRSSRTA